VKLPHPPRHPVSGEGSADAPVRIRRYAPADFDDVSDVCLRTSDNGEDGTGLFASDQLVADIFARPYVLFDPEHAFVLDTGERVSGYVICAADTARFVERYRAEWLPGFAQKYVHVTPPSTRDEEMRDLGFRPERMLIPEVDRYPAHLHIDLLSPFRRQGWGRALIATLVSTLRAERVRGLHLTMDPANIMARAFYDQIGFQLLASSTPTSPRLGLQIG
jgi:ribosomal protein S18 acetylase RimI-like enzyme